MRLDNPTFDFFMRSVIVVSIVTTIGSFLFLGYIGYKVLTIPEDVRNSEIKSVVKGFYKLSYKLQDIKDEVAEELKEEHPGSNVK